MKRRSPPKQQPPENDTEGAARIRAALIEIFDRRDGSGADWRLMVESLYRAGFQIIGSGKLDEADKGSLLRRVHEGAYNRLTESGAEKPDSVKGEAPALSEFDAAARLKRFPAI